MTTFAVELVLDDLNPRRIVSTNRRIHHMVRSELCAYWRKAAHDAAVAAYGYADVGETWHKRVRIVITYRFPDKRRRETSNLYTSGLSGSTSAPTATMSQKHESSCSC